MIQLLIPVIGKVLDSIFPDPKTAAEAKVKVMEMAQAGELAALEADVKIALGQMEINKVEASNPDVFVSGWRPAVGWVCVLGLGYSFLGFPILSWVSTMSDVPVPPNLDLGTLITMLGGLLGLGGFRTYEKVKGAARDSM